MTAARDRGRTVERFRAKVQDTPPDARRRTAQKAKAKVAALRQTAERIEGYLGRLQVSAGVPWETDEDLDRYLTELSEIESDLEAWTYHAESLQLEEWNRAAGSREGGDG